MTLFDKIIQQQTVADQFGFSWDNIGQLLQQIINEVHEVAQAAQTDDKAHLQEEIGDVMNAAVCLCFLYGFDPATTLAANIDKFQQRFTALVRFVQEDGLTDLQGQPTDVLMHYWNKAKQYCDTLKTN